MGEVRDLALAAKRSSRTLGCLGRAQRDGAVRAMAASLREDAESILVANGLDIELARGRGIGEQLIDRLMLDGSRIEGMAAGLEEVAAQPDPLGRIVEGHRLPNGLEISKVTVPLGVVAVVFEARPNVVSDAAGLCVKTGNACVLRGGSLASNSCRAIGDSLRRALVGVGLPEDAVCVVSAGGHEAVEELFGLVGIIDVLIPRGGANLIRNCVENAKVPVIETGTGNCHTYVHETADLDMARDILVNAKCQRPSVCNACESLLVDRALVARDPDALPTLVGALTSRGVTVHGCQETLRALEGTGIEALPATEDDWGREYLGLEISCKVVGGPREAIDHINAYGTGHSECVVTRDYEVADLFAREVDAAAVYVNASTRFTDGGMFGLGAEIGISTQKLHARGPMGADALVSTKYVCRGGGQTR